MEWHVAKDLLTLYPSDEWLIGFKGAWGDFLIVEEEAERLGLIDKTTIGGATFRLFEAKPFVDLYEQLLNKDPYRMFGIRNEIAG